MLSNLFVRDKGNILYSYENPNLELMISIASSKPSTAMIGRMGPNISLKLRVRMAKYVQDSLSHSVISGSPSITPPTIVGAIYLVDESVSKPETIVPLVFSSNPLTRTKCASVGALAKDSFKAPLGKNSETLIHRRSPWPGPDIESRRTFSSSQR